MCFQVFAFLFFFPFSRIVSGETSQNILEITTVQAASVLSGNSRSKVVEGSKDARMRSSVSTLHDS